MKDRTRVNYTIPVSCFLTSIMWVILFRDKNAKEKEPCREPEHFLELGTARGRVGADCWASSLSTLLCSWVIVTRRTTGLQRTVFHTGFLFISKERRHSR